MKRTKADFFALLDEWKREGALPNGKSPGRYNVVSYMKETYPGEFVDMFSRPVKTFETWYKQHAKGEKCTVNPQFANRETVHESPAFTSREQQNITIAQQQSIKNGIDPSINILDDDLDIEEGLTEAIEPYVIANGDKKYLIINDLHIPWHNLKALRIAINYGRERRVSGIIINGDCFDFYGISRHDKQPNKPKLRDEIAKGIQFLEQLRKLFPSEHIVLKQGNHENRLDRYIYTRAPELFGVDALSLKELLKLKDFNIHHVESTQLIKMGELYCAHGHEFIGGGVYVARSKRLQAGTNLIFGHHHRTQIDPFRKIDDKIYCAWAVGCLCDLKPAYMPNNQWNLGFGLVSLSHDGSFTVDNKMIVDGVVR